MRRPWWKRAVAALMLAWLAVVQTTPEAVHSCPVHDGHAGTAAHSHGAAAQAMPQAMLPGHVHGQLVADAHQTPSQGRLQCTCMETCALCAAGAQLPLPPSAPTALISQVSSATVTFAPEPPAATRAHVLPFANGPPPA